MSNHNQRDPRDLPELELVQASPEPTRSDLLKKFVELESKVDEVLQKIRERKMNANKRKVG